MEEPWEHHIVFMHYGVVALLRWWQRQAAGVRCLALPSQFDVCLVRLRSSLSMPVFSVFAFVFWLPECDSPGSPASLPSLSYRCTVFNGWMAMR